MKSLKTIKNMQANRQKVKNEKYGLMRPKNRVKVKTKHAVGVKIK